MKNTKKTFITFLSITVFILGAYIVSPSISDAYSRTNSGAVWNMDKLLIQYDSPNYHCKAKSVTCTSDNSQSVIDAQSKVGTGSGVRNRRYQCTDEGRVCYDRVEKQLLDTKELIGPNQPLGQAFIPSVTSFKVYNSDGEDVTHSSCLQPGESIDFVIASEHRTCGTRALITHYDVQFAGQSGHASERGDVGIRTTHHLTGGFTFTVPLEEGDHVADVTTINPIAPWMRYRGSAKSRLDYLLENAMSGYYTYERGTHTINVCSDSDSNLKSICTASPLQVKPGEDVTFTVSAAKGVGPYTYEWSDAAGSTGSSISTSYSVLGSHSQTVTVTDSVGSTRTANCSVTVTSTPGFDVNDDDGGGGTITDNAEIINFESDRLITNDKCTFEWETEEMVLCRIVNQTNFSIEVPFTGTKDLSGGTYNLECISALTGRTFKSDSVRCLLNPDVREF
ncbi:hypothetical protein N9L18_01115 [Candidatus Pacebacteria bacterium]|nr:hypothetical protein [Candidatus Paceibacterota bacterium]